jgi:hypothetical protein
MTDFKTETRKMCRNPKCRSKLPAPVSNAREAFCCRGCYSSFYLHRCIVCEDKIERTTANRKICKKSKCRNALAVGEGFGRFHANSTKTYQGTKNLEPTQETLIPCGSASASNRVERNLSTPAAKAPHDCCAVCRSEGLDSGLYDRQVGGGWIAVCADCLPGDEWKACQPEPDDTSEPFRPLKPKAPRPWRVVAAGSPISANVYHCAAVSDAPNGGLPDILFAAVWANGDWEKTEARNRARLYAYYGVPGKPNTVTEQALAAWPLPPGMVGRAIALCPAMARSRQSHIPPTRTVGVATDRKNAPTAFLVARNPHHLSPKRWRPIPVQRRTRSRKLVPLGTN